MRTARALIVLILALPGAASAQDGCFRLSWGTCEPLFRHNCFQGQGKYQLVLSATGISQPNLGFDFTLRLFSATNEVHCYQIPDVWRFDDAGCQTGSRLSLGLDGVGPSCPAIKGANVREFTNYSLYDSYAYLRFSIIYDSVTPNPSTRYTLWVINFDLSHATMGPSPPDLSSCGGAEVCTHFYVDQPILLASTGETMLLASCDGPVTPFGPIATWGDESCVCDEFGPRPAPGVGDCAPVASEPLTWGKMRAMYR